MGKDSEFLDAARTGNIQVVEKVLSSKTRRSGPLASLRRGPGANVQDSSGYTALHHASLNGHRSVVSTLLRHEASVNVQDNKGSTPLHLAAWAGHDQVIKVLLTQGPSVPHINHQNKGGDTALHFAAQYGHTETARFLLKRGADPTLPNLKAEAPLDLAAQFGRLAIAELLLREENELLKAFSIDAATTAVFPHTPLHLASRNGHLNVVKLLLSHGHHVNVRTSQGSPLHEAAICGKVDVVRALMEAGADSEVRNDLGYTVLDTISSIHTPVTQEISGLIKSQHARLIDIDDIDTSSTVCSSPPTDFVCDNKTEFGVSPTISVSPSASFEFPSPAPSQRLPYPSTAFQKPHLGPSSSLASSPSPSTTSSPLSFFGRPSSSISNPFPHFVSFLQSDTLRSASSSSSSPPTISPPSIGEIGVYENVLVPTRLHNRGGDQPMRTVERRPKSRSITNRRTVSNSRISERSARSSDGKEDEFRLSVDRDDRLSDHDRRRISMTSEYSVYDVPLPRSKVMTSTSDKSSLSTRSSSTHDILEDDEEATYEVPPPPRPCSATLRSFRDFSDGEASKPHPPPPKPPRKSICPSSPGGADTGEEDRSYEMICFATSGRNERKSIYENASNTNVTATAISQPKVRPSDRMERGGKRYGGTSSDSDSDSGVSNRRNTNSNCHKAYFAMSFKPVKSRRTTKSQNIYENTVHRYENSNQNCHKQPSSKHSNKDDPLDPLVIKNHSNGVRHGSRRPQSDPRPRGDPESHSSSDEVDAVLRPRSLDDVLRPRSLDVAKSKLPTPDHPPPSARQAQIYIQKKFRQVSQEISEPKCLSKDAETETEPDESISGGAVSTTIGCTPPPLSSSAPHGSNGTAKGGTAEGPSSGSLSSASGASLSDQSASTDTIEEVRSDVPFAGLFRGSRTSSEWTCVSGGTGKTLDRPRSLSPTSVFTTFEKGCRNSCPIVPTKMGAKNNDCDNNNHTNNNIVATEGSGDPRSEKGVTGVTLSPLEEDEEWARIGDIMASFGGGLTRESVFMAELELEFQQRLGMSLSPSQHKLGFLSKRNSAPGSPELRNNSNAASPPDVNSWLKNHGLGQYEASLLAHGYDHINFMNGLLDNSELEEMGITDTLHRKKLLSAVSSLPSAAPNSLSLQVGTLEEWLSSIHLPQYVKVFHKHGFGEMDRVRKIWEVELSVVLEVTLLGHRKRMLASLGDRPIEPELPASLAPQDLSLELSKLNTDITQLKEKLFQELPMTTCRERRPPETATNTIRRGNAKRKAAPPPPPPKAPRMPKVPCGENGSNGQSQCDPSSVELALRDPAQLVVGVPKTRLTEWKHHPTKLLSDNIQYVAQYLGSTHVKELKGTESTMKSIQKLRRSTTLGAKVPSIKLAVSYLGVMFIDAVTQFLVCEHEIRNIHCACQDADDLCHFAYITKDTETQSHYCHVFRVQSSELAAEIILTLGEAFEVAYQLTMRDQQQESKHRRKDNRGSSVGPCNQSDEQKLTQGHTRSKSELVFCTKQPLSNGAHVRSISCISNNFPTRGTTAPSSSLENILSDSGNFSDKDPDTPSCLRESSSPSVDSSSTSGSMFHPFNSGGQSAI